MAKIVVKMSDGKTVAKYTVDDGLVEDVVQYVRDAVRSVVVARERDRLLAEIDSELAKRVNALVVIELEPAAIALQEATATIDLGDSDARDDTGGVVEG